jgi:hydrogenase maturation protease
VTGRPLVIGYGNPLRGDDGVGWHAAAALARDPRLDGADVIARHQLTPELAEDVARSGLLVLVDACAGTGEPGTIRIRPIAARPTSACIWSHHLEPATLIELADRMYGAAPPAVLVTVTGARFDHADQLTAAVLSVLPGVVDAVAALIVEGAVDDRGRRQVGPRTDTGHSASPARVDRSCSDDTAVASLDA